MPATVTLVLFSVVPIIQDVFLVLLFVHGMVLRKKRKDTQYDRLVSLSPVLLWVGTVCGGVFSIPVTLFGTDDIPGGVWCFFEVVVLACIAMMLAYCNETVTYDESRFETKNLFGRKRSYGYGEITGISSKGGDTILYCGRRRIRLDTMSSGDDEFVTFAAKTYYRQHKKDIPVQKPKKDPMNGNLDTPWLYFSIYLLGFAGFFAMIVLPVYSLRPADSKLPADAMELRTSFSSYERTRKEQGTLILHAADYEKPFTLSWLSGYEITLPAPETLCSGEEYVLIIEEGKEEYWIYSMSTGNGREIMNAYDRNTACRNTQIVPCIGLLIFGILGAVFCIFGILVGRHPERYPGWFCGLFYKRSAWMSPTGGYLNTYSNRRNKKPRRGNR